MMIIECFSTDKPEAIRTLFVKVTLLIYRTYHTCNKG